MLETKVALIQAEELAAGLDKLILVAKLIKVGDNPYIKEEEAAEFDSVVDYHKHLEPNHLIRQRYPTFRLYQAHKKIQNYFISQQIEEATYDLIDMYKHYKSIKDGNKPRLKQSDINKFRIALDRFKLFVQSGKINLKYSIALPKLEEAYVEVVKCLSPEQ